MIAGIIGVGLIGTSVYRWIRYQQDLKAALEAQAERDRVATPEIMAAHRFAEVADVADVTDPHLAKKIREELENQRLKRTLSRG